jgi:hypothetical protein
MTDCCPPALLRANIGAQSKAATVSAPCADPTIDWLAAILDRCGGSNADAWELADATVALWFDIAAALQIIIGKQGFAALYNRAAVLAAQKLPWLGAARAGDDFAAAFASLQAMLAEQGDENAALGATELLQAFRGLLADLVGERLCARMLASVIEQPT